MELLCHSVKAPFKPAEDLCTLQLAPILGNQAVAVKRIIIESESRVRGPNLVWVGVLQKDGWGWRHLRIYKPATIPGDHSHRYIKTGSMQDLHPRGFIPIKH